MVHIFLYLQANNSTVCNKCKPVVAKAKKQNKNKIGDHIAWCLLFELIVQNATFLFKKNAFTHFRQFPFTEKQSKNTTFLFCIIKSELKFLQLKGLQIQTNAIISITAKNE